MNGGGTGAYASAFEIEVSDDGVNWSTAAIVSDSSSGLEIVPVGASGRYLRILCKEKPGYGNYAIWEARVLSGGVNVALNKPASASSTRFPNAYLPFEAFDGNGGSQWATEYAAPAPLKLNLPDGKKWFTVSVLNSLSEAQELDAVANRFPGEATVDYSYDQNNGDLSVNWSVPATDRNNGVPGATVLSFAPHHYKRSESTPAFMPGKEYMSMRGVLKLAEGNNFTFDYVFNGIIPSFAEPDVAGYDRSKVEELLERKAGNFNFGGGTYWGGKDLVKAGKYLLIAKEIGHESAAYYEQVLKEALADWFSYEPGETEKYFAWYPKWKALIGFNDEYGSATFTDNHFHYGYYTHAAALLAMVDKDWVMQYEEILTYIAKQYANWDRNDANFPYLRTMDPWIGHSYAGGLGSGGGNNQESSSEAVQSWIGLFLLGEMLGNDGMLDTGAFGYLYETRSTMQYWMDVDEDFFPEGYEHSVVGILWNGGYNFGTYFGDNPWYIFGIQWLPACASFGYFTEGYSESRAIDVYNEILDESYYWAVNTAIPRSEASLSNKIANGEDTFYDELALEDLYNTISDGQYDESEFGNDWANIILHWRAIHDPDYTLNLFDQWWNESDIKKQNVVRNSDEAIFTYFYGNNYKAMGKVDRSITFDVPTAIAYVDDLGQRTYVVYNSQDTEVVATALENGNPVASFRVPAGKIVSHKNDAALAEIKLESANKTIVPGSSVQIDTVGLDQYGATFDLNTLSYNVNAGGVIDANGVFTATAYADPVIITAQQGGVSEMIQLRVGDAPYLDDVIIDQGDSRMEVGESLTFDGLAVDQYGDPWVDQNIQWVASGVGSVSVEGEYSSANAGQSTLIASVGASSSSVDVEVFNVLPNLSLQKPVEASGSENPSLGPEYAVDGDLATRWASTFEDPSWLVVDLGDVYDLKRAQLEWQNARSSEYEVQVSMTGEDGSWETVTNVTSYIDFSDTLSLFDTPAQFIRVYGTARATDYGHSLWEFEVYGYPHDESYYQDDDDNNNEEPVSIQIEAEDYVAFNDADTGNNGGTYRNDDVDIEPSSEGGYNIGWTMTGEWLRYTADLPSSGEYTITLRTSSPNDGTVAKVLVNGSDVSGDLAVVNTGGWQNWVDLSFPANLTSGSVDIEVQIVSGGFNFNYLKLEKEGDSTGGGETIEVQAEDYTAFLDNSAGNIGGVYRNDDVDLEPSSTGNFNVGWSESGEWLQYNVDVQTGGSFDILLDVSSVYDNLALLVKVNGVEQGTISFDSTGGWQSWNTVTGLVNLQTGNNVIELEFQTGNINLDQFILSSE